MVDNYYKNQWKKRNKELVNKKIISDSEKESLDNMISSPDHENFVLAKEILRLKISDALIQDLNDDQKESFVKIIKEFTNPKHDAIVLKGYAGTGKTYLIKRIIEYIKASYPARKIAITAPTNKAVHVSHKSSALGEGSRIFEEYGKASDRIVYCTIHKLLGLREQISNTGKQMFVADKKKSDVSDYRYLIVDEVSMLDDSLFKQIMKFKDNIRIIFMGDPCQIPPINKEYSIPFKTNPGSYSLLKLELSEIMRQSKDHPIVNYGMTIRKNLNSKNPVGELKTILNKDGLGLIYIDGKKRRNAVKQIMKQYFTSDEFEIDSDYMKIIGWRNKTINYLNNEVRKIIYSKDAKKFMIGDKLIANKALFSRHKHTRWGVYIYKIKANTSDEFVVKHVDIITKQFKDESSLFNTTLFSGKFWKLNVINQNGENLTLNVIHQDSEEEYKEHLNELKKVAKKRKDADSWVQYYNVLKWSDNVNYNYTITAHKSQGSTYQNVLLIEEDLDHNKKLIERNRIKYTAYTRATDRLYVLK